MEERSVKLSLDRAKRLYNTNDDELKQIAFQAYTKEELADKPWEFIKTFEDACNFLHIDYKNLNIIGESKDITLHLVSIYRLDIIRKALNNEWTPDISNDVVYYPAIKLCKSQDAALKEIESSYDHKICGRVELSNHEYYYIVGGDYYCTYAGVCGFEEGTGNLSLNSLMACKSEEIAKYMSSQFAEEIFWASFHYENCMYEKYN